LSSLIKWKDVCKAYVRGSVETTVLHSINLEIYAKELVAIIGSSGSGKSSMMNIMGLLDKQTSGEYWLNGKNIATLTPKETAKIRNQQIGFVFQSFYLLPSLTVLENVGLPLTYQALDKKTIEEQSHKMLQRVGLDHVAHRFPNELSGGQQQRIAIARALVTNPSVILADEPTGALDSKVGQEIMQLFMQINQIASNTIIIITHDQKIADQCKRIIRVQDGRIQ
jgi:putative ABC transport system ATP-binding protein